MSDDQIGTFSPIVSVRPGRDRNPDRDRATAEFAKQIRDERKGQGKGGGRQKKSSLFGEGHAPARDNMSFLGIPEHEMTDAVRHALEILTEEIDHLRHELARAKDHEAYLEAQAEKDRLTQVMRRRAFLARIMLSVRRAEDEHADFAFVYIAITNALDLRATFGHGAAETLLSVAAEGIKEVVEPGDVIGSLESFDFGVILPGTNQAKARTRAEEILQALHGRTFAWQGEMLKIEADFGLCTIFPGDSAEEVIDRAQRHQRDRTAHRG